MNVEKAAVMERTKGGERESGENYAEELRKLKEAVEAVIRNQLVLPNTMLEIACDRKLTCHESEDASKCIRACIAMVEASFIEALHHFKN
jgi:aromatic ring hydroxylase